MIMLKERIHSEILQAGVEIWKGVWYGLILCSWIWAFVLFDTLASSVGVKEGIWVFIVMILSPLVWKGIELEFGNLMATPEMKAAIVRRQNSLASLRTSSRSSISSRRLLSRLSFSFSLYSGPSTTSSLPQEQCIEMNELHESQNPLSTRSI
jgi:hypothetical protein